MNFASRFAILVLSVTVTSGKTINNSLVGDPVVRCGPERIEIEATAESPFAGVVYLKNWRRAEGCFRSYESGSSGSNPVLGVPLSSLGSCGLEMRRKPTTKELEIFGVFVFSFHPMFVTMGDRAFAVHCIFRQRDVTVGSGFQLGDFATVDTISRRAEVPKVALRIVPGGIPDVKLDPAGTVSVGDPLMFIWHLPRPSEVYGIRVRDCTAETKKGRQVRIVSDGCTMDAAAMDTISYSDDMSKAFASAQAFKFADVEDMWFKCTVSTCVKSSESSNGVSEDVCRSLQPECSVRVKRATQSELFEPIVPKIDDEILEQRLLILDAYNRDAFPRKKIKSDKKKQKLITLFDNLNGTTSKMRRTTEEKLLKRKSWQICMRKPIFALVTSVILIMYTVTFVLGAVAVVMYWNRWKYSTGTNPQLLISSKINSYNHSAMDYRS